MYEPKDCKYFENCAKIRGEKVDGKIDLYNGWEHTCWGCSELEKAGEPAEPDAETQAKLQADLDRQVERLRKGGGAMKN